MAFSAVILIILIIVAKLFIITPNLNLDDFDRYSQFGALFKFGAPSRTSGDSWYYYDKVSMYDIELDKFQISFEPDFCRFNISESAEGQMLAEEIAKRGNLYEQFSGFYYYYYEGFDIICYYSGDGLNIRIEFDR